MSDQPKWTPGPWLITTPTQGYEICTMHGLPSQPTEDGRGQTWAYIRPESRFRDGEWHWPDEQEQLANAHLIAAAPDLYAALESAREKILWLVEAWDADAETDRSEWFATIDAAIAKARGEAK